MNNAHIPFLLCLQSDSANLDNVTELLVQSGTPVETALMALVPEAYRNHPDLMKNYPEVRLPIFVGYLKGPLTISQRLLEAFRSLLLSRVL